ncbi:MAG TPA: pentapeptide repeat-containing protein [Gallionella sp.]|nr:pentapeptide repeat-containing protein [Gallionella sp.]
MQESESEFRRPRQVLTALPYFEKKPEHQDATEDKYRDPAKLLEQDLRQDWWKNYGRLTGHNYKKLPTELDRDDLLEITAQPLLNYLLALSFCRKTLDFSAGVNLNQIYQDLVEAVYERGYEKRRHASVQDLEPEDFFLVLEEIGLAAWHGDGRTTTVAEIEKHCRDGGLGKQLDAFQEGAKLGITRLLAAFFFRQHGERPKGDPTFVFTHKSFGEYLAARRLVHAMQDIVEERQRRLDRGGSKGWSEADALQHWAEWCGPTALSPYIHRFLMAEVALVDKAEIAKWQEHFAHLFSYMLRHGMPMERLQLATFQDALFQSRNAEEALLAALNACARVTKQVSPIDLPASSSFSTWQKRIQGQRVGGDIPLATYCFSWLSLDDSTMYASDFVRADFSGAELNGTFLTMSVLGEAKFVAAKLTGANLFGTYCGDTNFFRAELRNSEFLNANLSDANLSEADLSESNLTRANLSKANLSDANLSDANLSEADLIEANLTGANLTRADLSKANLSGAKISNTNFDAANLEGAIFDEGMHPHDKKTKSSRRVKDSSTA